MEQTSSNSTINLFFIKHKKAVITLLTISVLFLLQNILFDLIFFSISSVVVLFLVSILFIIAIKSIKWLFYLLISGITIYAVFALLILLVSI